MEDTAHSSAVVTESHLQATVTVTEGHSAHSAKEENPLLKLNPGITIWTWVVFVALLLILWKAAWRKILNLLDDRENYIKNSLAEADKASVAIAEALKEQKKILSDAQVKAAEIVSKAYEAASEVASDIEKRAHAEENRLLKNAREEIESERRKAVAHLREEAARLALGAATKVIHAEMSSDRNKKLVEEFILQSAKG
jgi:F-type H+-transporting ATPase subunit b